MQAQTEKSPKGELIIEIRGRTVGTTIKEVGSNGVKLEMNDVSEVSGKYNARHMETVNVELKADGSNEWETKGIENTPEGDMIVITGKGKGQSTGPTTANWSGEYHFMTKSPRLKWLDGTKAWIEGTGNMATGEHSGKVYKK